VSGNALATRFLRDFSPSTRGDTIRSGFGDANCCPAFSRSEASWLAESEDSHLLIIAFGEWHMSEVMERNLRYCGLSEVPPSVRPAGCSGLDRRPGLQAGARARLAPSRAARGSPLNGLEWFGWTCLEDRAWVHTQLDTPIPTPLCSDEAILRYVRTCSQHRAPMTFNVGIYRDGTLAPGSVDQLSRLDRGLKGGR